MPQVMQLGTSSTPSVKRQRSQESTVGTSEAASSVGTPSVDTFGEQDTTPQKMTVRIPPYLSKSRSEISACFQDLEWKQRSRLAHALQNPESSPYRISRTPITIGRNRYANVQPWDESRVRLKKPIDGSDYVNASPITLYSRNHTSKNIDARSTPLSSVSGGTDIPTKYIATQGPREGQFSHFWHMVMQETPGDVGVIVMLTRLFEGNKEKCSQYYPSDMKNPTLILDDNGTGKTIEETEDQGNGDPFLDPPMLRKHTNIRGAVNTLSVQAKSRSSSRERPTPSQTVTLLSSHYDPTIKCEVRELKLSLDGQSKTIYHYFFNSWPDFGKPEAEDRKALLELTKVSAFMARDAPRFVHCSAGVGRTGTWIALDFLLRELESGRLLESSPSSSTSSQSGAPPDPQDAPLPTPTWGRSGPAKVATPDPEEQEDFIAETVNSLREQRMMMVMNELQYSFIYEVVRDAFIEKYAEKQTGPIVIEVQEPSPKIARTQSPFHDLHKDSRTERLQNAEDESASEAETEIIDEDNKVAGDKDSDETIVDPYSAVAPDTIRQGIMKEKQDGVEDNEAT